MTSDDLKKHIYHSMGLTSPRDRAEIDLRFHALRSNNSMNLILREIEGRLDLGSRWISGSQLQGIFEAGSLGSLGNTEIE